MVGHFIYVFIRTSPGKYRTLQMREANGLIEIDARADTPDDIKMMIDLLIKGLELVRPRTKPWPRRGALIEMQFQNAWQSLRNLFLAQVEPCVASFPIGSHLTMKILRGKNLSERARASI